MGDHVNRRYNVASRQESSAATRQRIVEAARALMLERGYRATTVAAVARAAGVSVDTVYELVGRKPLLLRELIEQALSGTDHEVVAEDRAHVRAMRAEPDPAVKLAIYARAIRDTHERMAPLFLALRDAAATEPEAQQVWQEISDRRAANMRKLVRDLRAAGGLRRSITIGQAADTVWAMNSAELYVLLTAGRGWSPSTFERWLRDSLCRLLLPDPPAI